MPDEQKEEPFINPTLEKPKRNWKQIGLVVFLLALAAILVGVGIYFYGTGINDQLPTNQKESTSSAKKQTENKKGVLYLKPSEENPSLPIDNFLGDLWVYDLNSQKETKVTNNGGVANYPIKLSPDGKKIAYRKNIGDMESL